MTAAVSRPRIPRRPVHGVLVIDKPWGWSSHDALSKAKRLMRAEKAGHTGTLDPMATGVLPLCFGAATKFSQISLDADKGYRAGLHLGITRSGGDLEGEILTQCDGRVSRAALEAACAHFLGPIDQIPPMHSALKHGGKPLYELARQGLEIERAPRRVHLHHLAVAAGEGDAWTLEVLCSKGTYIRTLAQDLGAHLGVGAHLSSLRRTQVGPFLDRALIRLDELEALDEAARDALLLPPDVLLQADPAVRLSAAEAAAFLAGMRRRGPWPDAERVRVYGPQPAAFLGSARVVRGELIPIRLLSPLEVQALTEFPTF